MPRHRAGARDALVIDLSAPWFEGENVQESMALPPNIGITARDFLKTFTTTICLPGQDQKSNCFRWGKGGLAMSCGQLQDLEGGQKLDALEPTLHPWISRRGLLLLTLWILVLNGFEAKLSSHAIYCQIATTRHMPPLPHWKYKEHCDSGRRTQKKCGVV